MKIRDSRLYDALEYLDEAYIAEVVENLKVPPAPGMPVRKRGQLRYMVAFAACLLVLSMAIPVITYVMRNFGDIAGWFTDETTSDTSQNLTEPETPPSETTAPPAPETSENTSPETAPDTDHETTAPLYDGTTAEPEVEYDGSRGLLYKMSDDGKSYYLAGMGICTDENIVVASTYDGYPVTVIGEAALSGYPRVKSVTIPETVTAIDMRAFKNCTGLESVTLHDGIYYIGADAFESCELLKSITLPQALEQINTGVFMNCPNLEKVVVPAGVERIVYGAFYDCPKLTSLDFAGTTAEWNAIEKEDDWNYKSVIEVVHCSDGDVNLIEYDGSQGLKYEISDDGTYAALVGIGTCTDKDIVTATYYNGVPVTMIAGYAFSNVKGMTSITVSKGVSYIESCAFSNCSNLKAVYLPSTLDDIGSGEAIGFTVCHNIETITVSSDNPKYYSVGNCLIERKTGALAFACSKSVIPTDGSIKSIGPHAFGNAVSIVSIDIPEGVVSIGDGAFSGCTALRSVSFPESLESVCAWAFADCSSLESVKLADNVTLIGWEAFLCCTSLKEVTLPKEVEDWSWGIFDGCSSLESVVLPKGIKDPCGFRNCTRLESVILPEGMTELSGFEGCISLSSITIPSTVTKIYNASFADCTSLTDFRFAGTVAEWNSIDKGKAWNDGCPFTVIHCSNGDVEVNEYDGSRGLEYSISDDGKSASLVGIGTCTDKDIVTATYYNGVPVTMIAGYAFSNVKGMTSITVSDSVEYISSYAFENCYDLKSVTIPNSLKSIGIGAFQNCEKLESIDLSGIEILYENTFDGCTSLRSVTGAENLTKIYPCAFRDCTSLVSFNFGDKLTLIDSLAFKNCASLKSIDIPASVTEIGQETFGGCSSLESVTIRGAVKSLYAGVFSHCSNLKNVTFSEGVKGISYYAFEYCTSLEKITLPSSITTLGEGAFYNCTALTSINIPEGVTKIGSHAFSECSSLKEITIPEGVTVIQDEAFYLCKNLKKVTLPSTLEYIQDWAFANCESLESIVIPDSVKWICQNSFRDCKSLSSVTLGKGLEQIQGNAFWNCSSVKSLKIPGGVSFFGNNAFANCTALRSVTVEKGIEYIPSVAFSGCTSLTEFIFSGSVAEWNALSKGTEWSQNCPFTEIVCSDGKATVSLLGDLGAIEAAREYWGLDANAVIIVSDDPSADSPLYKIAHCEYAQSVGEFEIKREVCVDPATGECSEVVFDYSGIPEMFLDIILNKEKFIYVNQQINANGEYQYTTEEVLFKDFSFTGIYEIFGKQSLNYALLDIDGDSVSELIIPGEARLRYGIMLRMYEGKIYGYRCMLDDLYTDATYRWHEQAGNYRGISQVYFDGIFYKSKRLLEYDMNDPDNVKYYVEGKETTKEEYEKYESALVGEPVKFTNLDPYPIYVNPYPGG